MCKKVNPKMINQGKTLEESRHPLNLLNAFLGLSIFEMPCSRPWPKLSILYVLIRSLAYGALLWYVGTYVPVKHSNIKIILVVYRVILVVNIIIAAMSTVLAIINYRCSSAILKRLRLADETLEVFGIDPDYISEYKLIVRRVIMGSVVAVLIFCCDVAINCIVFEDLREGILVTIIFDVPLLQNPSIEMNFGVQISMLGRRFERLNALIQSVTDSSMSSTNPNDANKYKNILKCNQRKVAVRPTFYQQNQNNLELLLKVTRQLHLDLCGISRKVNDVCSKQMSMQMAATFLLLTGFSYSLYLVYNEPYIPLEQKVQQYVSLAIWIAISIFRLIHVVRISVNVTTEAQKTSQIAHEIQVPRSKNKLIDEIHQLSLQIMQHPLYFTASGLIVLDFGYVRGFVGSVTTYLMILIQNQPDMLKAANTLGALDNNTEKLSRMLNLDEGMEKPFLPMLLSNWIFGIGIFEFPIGKPRKLFSFIYTSIILSSFLYLNYRAYPYYAVTKLAKMSPTTNGMFYYANTFVTISVLVAGWFQSKGLHKCMLSAAKSNLLLQKIGIQRDHSKILIKELSRFLKLFVYIVAVIIVNCAITKYHRNLGTEEIITLFVQNFPIVVVFIADASFMNILGYAHHKFENLNETFQKLLTSTDDVPLYRIIANEVSATNVRSHDDGDKEEKDYTFIVKTGKLVHLELIKLCREGNKTYGFHILISLVVAFTMMINNVFNIYLSLSYSVFNYIKFKEISRSINWFLYFWIKTTTNSQLCTTVSRSANKIGDIICELYDEDSINASTKAEIRRFNINLVQNKLKLSACGIVNIDLTLIPTMMGVIGTYFIIIMQFQNVKYTVSRFANETDYNKF